MQMHRLFLYLLVKSWLKLGWVKFTPPPLEELTFWLWVGDICPSIPLFGYLSLSYTYTEIFTREICHKKFFVAWLNKNSHQFYFVINSWNKNNLVRFVLFYKSKFTVLYFINPPGRLLSGKCGSLTIDWTDFSENKHFLSYGINVKKKMYH